MLVNSSSHSPIQYPVNEYQNKLRSNCILNSINKIGHVLTYPTSLMLSDAVRIFVTKFTPGDQGQSECKAVEIAIRIFLLLRFPLLLAYSLTIGSIGAVLRMITSYPTQQDLVLEYFDDAHNHSFEGRDLNKLKVGTFNVGAGPDMMSLRNKLAKPLDRVQDWAELVLDDNKLGGCDVLLFQEMFHTEATEKFLEMVKRKYPYAVYNVGVQIKGLSSGLVVISKVPLEDPKFWAHGVNRVGDDQFANKGLLAVTARISATSKAVLFTTHLNGGGSATIDGELVRSDECRSRQLRQIMIHQEEYREEAHRKADETGTNIAIEILGGDLNIGRFTDNGNFDREWESREWSSLLEKNRNMIDQDISDEEARLLMDKLNANKQNLFDALDAEWRNTSFERMIEIENFKEDYTNLYNAFLRRLENHPNEILLYQGTTYEMNHHVDEHGNRPKLYEMVDYQFVPNTYEYRNIRGTRRVVDIGRTSDHAAIVVDYEGLSAF